jgi:hypothetical protein
VGDAAAEARGRAAVDAACAAKACWGSLFFGNDLPLLPTLRAWQRVYGDRDQVLTLYLAEESSTPGEGNQGASASQAKRIPPEVIQQVVRRQFAKFRVCYDAGLSRNPDLIGIIEVRFLINREGLVTLAEDHGSNILDTAVRDCVIKEFRSLEFPAPEGGIVTVVYPIMLRPD